MKSIILPLAAILLTASSLQAQDYPIDRYEELPNPTATDPQLWSELTAPLIGWGSIDLRYPKERPAEGLSREVLTLRGWRGERLYAQLAVSSPVRLEELTYHLSEIVGPNGALLPSPTGKSGSGFVRYVMTDELNKDGLGGCGERPDASAFDSTLVADCIDHRTPAMTLDPRTTRAIWLSIDLSHDAAPGSYRAEVTLEAKGMAPVSLPLAIEVDPRRLPEESSFFLDLWQNPYAVARYYGLEPWSEAHFEAMRPYMEMYRDAGGKVITASIIYRPWDGQTYDPFDTMVEWRKDRDGQWHFDYDIFDRWVSFMMELGIDEAITCYSMVPWRLSFRYYDETTESYQTIEAEPGTESYTEIWTAMLRSFATHLREKGWMDRTYIAMDERSPEVMKECFRLIKAVDPDFKVSLAGSLDEELSDHLDYYCVAMASKFPEELKAKRRADGDITTFYTCCTEARPNTFTFSHAADGEWYGWYAAREGLDGYLRWALMSWVEQPLLDSRFISWAAGDTYLLYPGVRSSIRFERLRRGIQAFDKIRLLREQYAEDAEALAQIDAALRLFDEKQLGPDAPSAPIIRRARALIDQL